MNRPAYKSILSYSPRKPVIVFVSSRRQTRLTANDLISLCASDDNPRRFLKMNEADSTAIIQRIRDQSLAHALSFGIGLHHAGLVESVSLQCPKFPRTVKRSRSFSLTKRYKFL